MIFMIFFIDGVIFLYYYFGVKRKNDRLKNQTLHFRRTEGRVEEIQQKMNLKSAYPVIIYDACYSFCDESNQKLEGIVPLKKKESVNPGEGITVYYNPQNPQENLTDYHLENMRTSNRFFIGMMILIPLFIIGGAGLARLL